MLPSSRPLGKFGINSTDFTNGELEQRAALLFTVATNGGFLVVPPSEEVPFLKTDRSITCWWTKLAEPGSSDGGRAFFLIWYPISPQW